MPVHITDTNFPSGEFEFVLKKDNPDHAPILVTTGDIGIRNIAADKFLPKDEVRAIFPPDSLTGDFIPIVRLRPKLVDNVPAEGVHLTFKLSRGTGKEDGSFVAACTSTYSMTVDEARVASAWREKLAELKADGLNEEAIRMRENDWRSIDAKRLTVDKSFDFVIETVGVYECSELVRKACRIAIDNCEEFERSVDTGSLVVGASPTTMDHSFDVVI